MKRKNNNNNNVDVYRVAEGLKEKKKKNKDACGEIDRFWLLKWIDLEKINK